MTARPSTQAFTAPTLARLAIGSLLALTVCMPAVADRVRTKGESVVGEVVETTREGVVVLNDGRRVNVPVNEIRAILYDDEPAELAQARINAANGGYANAIERLDELPQGKRWPEPIDREIAFLRAVSVARIAIASDEGATNAGRLLTGFLREHGDSHHYYPAEEALGDLLASIGRADAAVARYERLASSGVDAYEQKAKLLTARAYSRVGRHEEALLAYAELVAAAAPGTPERREAKLGRAVSRAITGDAPAAIDAVREVIRAADGDAATLAAGYNALGRCYLAAGKSREALYAFLHTDLVHNEVANHHAEALSYLSDLWRTTGQPRRAEDAEKRLRRRYGRTEWPRPIP